MIYIKLKNLVSSHKEQCYASFFVLYCLIAVISVIGATKLSIGSDTRVLISDESAHIVNLNKFEDRFVAANYGIIVIQSDKPLLNDRGFMIMNNITEKMWRTSFVQRVESVTNHQFVVGESDELMLIEAGKSTQRLIDAYKIPIEQIIESNSFINKRLLSDDKKTAIIIANYNLDRDKHLDISTIYEELQYIAAGISAEFDGVKAYVSGDISSMAAYREATIKDGITLIPIGFVICILITSIAIGGIKLSWPIIVNITISSLAAAGASGWMNMPINPATAITPLIIFAIVTASSMHIFAKYTEVLSSKHPSPISKTIRSVYYPIFIANFLSTVGFTSLLFSSSPPIQMLGVMSIVGIATSVIGYLSIYLMHFRRIKEVKCNNLLNRCQIILVNLVKLANKRNKLTLSIFALIFCGTIFGVPNLKFNERFVEFFDDRYDFRIAIDILEENMGGGQIYDYTIFAPKGESILTPKYINKLSEFEEWLKDQKHVGNVTSIVPIIKRLNGALHNSNKDVSSLPLPETAEELAQYILLYEMSLPIGSDLTTWINIDKTASRVSFSVSDIDSEEIRLLASKIDDWFSANNDGLGHDLGTGISLMFAYLAIDVAKEVSIGIGISLVLITIILFSILRDITLVMFVLLANTLPIAAIFGFWGLIDGSIGVSSAVIVAMVLGIAIDDSVILIWSLKTHLKKKKDYTLAMIAAVKEVGPAMLTSTVALMVGYGIMYFSGFQITKEMGIFSSAIYLSAFIFDIILLPTVFILYGISFRKLERSRAVVRENS